MINFLNLMLRLFHRLLTWRALAVVFVLMAFGFAVASWIAAKLLISPAPARVAWPKGIPVTPSEVDFPATDGVHLKGWLLPQPRTARTVVLLHGVRANRHAMIGRALWLHELGYNVFLYDARGCGESERTALSFGAAETRDLLGSLDWLQGRGLNEVACIGCSQGAATILLASGQLPPGVRAVVAEASYATLRDTVDDHFRAHTGLPGGYFGALAVPIAEWKLGLHLDDVSPVRAISRLTVPVYLIGGSLDTLAPPEGQRKLFVAAPGIKTLWLVKGAGHADFFYQAPGEYQRRVGAFLQQYLR